MTTNYSRKSQRTNLRRGLGWIDFPRIHFCGTFFTNPSTDNNNAKRFAEAAELDYKEYSKKHLSINDENQHYDNWNPFGDGSWSFENCKVVNAYTRKGKIDSSLNDSFINPANNKIVARLVDLDTDQQGMSRIYGFGINIVGSGSKSSKGSKAKDGTLYLQSKYDPASFSTIWMRVKNGFWFGGYSASYISVLKKCEFSAFESRKFPALNDLREYAMANGHQLSIRFVVDGYNISPEAKNFRSGRVYGVIGVYSIGHPTRSLKYGRRLVSPPDGSGQFIWAKYDKHNQRLYLDLSDAIPTHRGPPVFGSHDQILWPRNLDCGTITLSCEGTKILNAEIQPREYCLVNYDYDEQKEKRQEETNTFIFGPESHRNPLSWLRTGGIYTLEGVIVTNEKAFESNPLTITFSAMSTARRKIDPPKQPAAYTLKKSKHPHSQPGYTATVKENSNGVWVQSENLQLRLGTSGKYPLYGKTLKQTVYVSKFGKPLTTSHQKMFNVTVKVNSGASQPRHKKKKVKRDEPEQRLPAKVTTEARAKTQDYSNWPAKVTTEDVIHNNYYRDKISDGFYSFQVIAPDTLKYNGKLPRAFRCQDSLVYNITCEYVDEDATKPSLKHKAGGDDDDNKNDEEKISDEPVLITAFPVGSVLVFDESNKLPAIVRWEPNPWVTRKPSHWKKVLQNMYGGQFEFYLRPIFRQYCNMYPVMKDIVNLDSYTDVTTKIPALLRAFNADFNSAHYMPVSRDISGQTLLLINSWLMNPIYCNAFVNRAQLQHQDGFLGRIRDLETLKTYLQYAIELELSTLPPYLSALYSIDPNYTKKSTTEPNTNVDERPANEYVINTLRSIVLQEMKHFTLACNLLISIGGTPKIADRKVLERIRFPRTGLVTSKMVNVLPDLPLALGPYAITGKASSVETFMRIEAPIDFVVKTEEDHTVRKNIDTEDAYVVYEAPVVNTMHRQPLQTLLIASKKKLVRKFVQFHLQPVQQQQDDTKTDEENANNVVPVAAGKHTIGEFYQLVRKGFLYLCNYDFDCDEIFATDEQTAVKRQVAELGAFAVYDLRTAIKAIQEIVAEGEGTSMTNMWSMMGQSGGKELSHFNKFMQLFEQKPILTVKLHKHPDPCVIPFEYVFAEEVVLPFDPAGVVDDPKAWKWLQSVDTATHENARDSRVNRFNETFGRLLICLQEAVANGQPGKMKHAIAIMRQLQVAFSECIRPPLKGGDGDDRMQPILPVIAPNWVPPNNIIP